MRLSQKELKFIKNMLDAKRAYRYSTLPCTATVWEPFMETLHTKITDELEV